MHMERSPNGLVVEEIGDQRKNRNYPDYSAFEIGKNTEKYPEGLRLAFPQNSMKNHNLKLVWKTRIT